MQPLNPPRSPRATRLPQDRPLPRKDSETQEPAEQPNPGDPGAPILEPRVPTDPIEDPRLPAVEPPKRGLCGVIALATWCVAGIAHAQEAPPAPELVSRDEQGNVVTRDDAAGFGAKGQWTFSTDATLSLERRTQSHTDASTAISIFPATDYFVIENLSIGGVIGVGYIKAGDAHSTIFRLGPRIGYNIDLSPLLSLWPKLGISYAHTTSEDSVTNASGDEVTDTTKNDAVQLNLFVPVMLHPAPHFFAGFGPFVDTDLNGDNRATTWGLRLTLGGWI
jgi:hypothetical protein